MSSIEIFIGEKICKIRKKRKLTQDDMASLLGISRQQVQKYEAGLTRVSVSTLVDICSALDVDISELLSGVDKVNTKNQMPSEYIIENRVTPLNVLIVEDSVSDEQLTRKALEKSGYECNLTTAQNGLDATELLRNITNGITPQALPDLVLLDLNIPRMKGIEVLRYIKTNHETQHIPVVIITNSITSVEMIKMYKSGASGYVVKSFYPKVYFEKIASIVNYWSNMALPSM